MTAAALIALVKSWVAKPPGSWIALALVALLALWGIHHHGYAAGLAECEVAHQSAASREIARQNAVGAAVVARAETRAVSDTAKDKSNREVIRYVVKTISAQPDADAECVPAAVADRLRDLD